MNSLTYISISEKVEDNQILLSNPDHYLYSKQYKIFYKKFSKLTKNWSNELKTLFLFIINQAIGVPSGDHGFFNM